MQSTIDYEYGFQHGYDGDEMLSGQSDSYREGYLAGQREKSEEDNEERTRCGRLRKRNDDW